MKALLIKILLAGAVVGGGVYVATQRHINLPFASQLKLPSNLQGSVASLTQNVGEQTKQLGERGAVVSNHVQNVLGAFVQENSSNQSTASGPATAKKPLHEQAFEYARYEYCKQVVTDYETNIKKN